MIFSLLEKLIDHSPQSLHDPSIISQQTEDQILTSLIKDLENLLNTRSSFLSLFSSFKELDISVLSYGIEDFTTFLEEDGEKLILAIKKAIFLYEPRLYNIKVGFKGKSPFIFIIEGEIHMPTTPYKIQFDINYFPRSFCYKIKDLRCSKGSSF